MVDRNSINVGRIGLKLVGVLAVGVLAYLWRPLFHFLVYPIFHSPEAFIGFGIPIFAGVVVFLLPANWISTDQRSSVGSKLTLMGIVVVMCWTVGMVYAIPEGMYQQRTLATDTMENTEDISEMPEVNAENARMIPRAVSDKQARGSVSYRTHQLGSSDIARSEDGNLSWSYSIQPDQFRNQLSGNQRGVLISDMTTMENTGVEAYDEQSFTHGKNMLLHRGVGWNLKKTGFWSQYRDDAVEFTHDGEAYLAFSKTGHEWNWSPIPHTVPTWDGVALVHQNGTIQHMSPKEAQESEILDGQRLYPLYNSEVRAESLEYRNGIVNQMPVFGTYEGVVQPAGLPAGADNSQPFVIDLSGENMAYTYAMEPAGADTRGLDEVWIFDAETGETMTYSTGDNTTLFGPERAMGVIRSEDTRTSWDTENSEGEFEVVEPVPTVINGEFWWHAKVVPVGNTDVNRNSFVNAENGDVVELTDTSSVVKFIEGEDVNTTDADNATMEDATEKDDVSYYIVIRDSDGNVIDEIPVKEGQDAVIEERVRDNADNQTST